MKIKELIEKLKSLNQEIEVEYVSIHEDGSLIANEINEVTLGDDGSIVFISAVSVTE